MSDDHLIPPSPDELDDLLAAGRGWLNVIPGAGGALAEILNIVVGSPIEKRRQEWANHMADAVRELRERGLTVEQLHNNPDFVNAVLDATSAAVRTEQAEKRRALRNAIVNAALPAAPDGWKQRHFIALLDRFSEWHVILLHLFTDPTPAAERAGYRPGISSTLSGLLEQTYPELRGQRATYDRIWADLNAASLVNTSGMNVMMTTSGAFQKRTTDLGDEFLKFIRDPSEDNTPNR